jgi:L-amino acid N-acyltransferase YncA
MTLSERIERNERIARSIHDEELDALRERYAPAVERETAAWPPTVPTLTRLALAEALTAKEYAR